MSAFPFIFASSFVSKPPLPQSTRTTTPRLSIATEAVVAGGGPAGLATAWVLATNGFDVTLIERRPKPSMYEPQRAYLYLVDGRGQQFTDLAGITEELASPELSVSSTNYTVTRLLPDGERTNAVPPILEPTDDKRPSYWIPRAALCGLLASALTALPYRAGQKPVKLLYGTDVKEITRTADGGVEVAYSASDESSPLAGRTSWTRQQPALLIGADGLNSLVRAKCAEWSDADEALDATADDFTPVRLPSPSSGLNYKMIRLPPDFRIAADDATATATPRQAYSVRPSKAAPLGQTRLGLLPVADPTFPRTANVILPPQHPVWSLDDSDAVKEWLSGTFPQLPIDAIISEDEADSFANGEPGAFPAPCYSPKQFLLLPSAGIGLVGDAVHAFPPDIGQGVNAALADVMLLSDAFDSAETISGGQLSATAAEAAASRMETLVRNALPLYGQACAPEAESVAKIAQVGFPYQYPITREKSPLARPLWFANFFLRTFVLSKLLPRFFSPAAIVLVQRPQLSYEEVWEEAAKTTRRMMALLAAVLAAVWAIAAPRAAVSAVLVAGGSTAAASPLAALPLKKVGRVAKGAAVLYSAWITMYLKKEGKAANPERSRAGDPIKCPWPFVLVALPWTELGRRSLMAGFCDWQTWATITVALLVGVRL